MAEEPAEPADDSVYTASLDTGKDEVVDLDETLGSDDIDDIMNTSYSPPEKPLGLNKFGTTLAEQRQGESLDLRVIQEIPDPCLAVDVEDPEPDEQADDTAHEVGRWRAGRLVDPDGGVEVDTEKDMVGRDVGIDGGAASAEEAAMHIIIDDEEDEE
jgi:hypothetical protein